jgi:glycosyltransferase involved in cell wall biosynthesis
LCAAMERLVTSGELRQQMGSRGRRRVSEHFTVDAMIAGTAETYRSALR